MECAYKEIKERKVIVKCVERAKMLTTACTDDYHTNIFMYLASNLVINARKKHTSSLETGTRRENLQILALGQTLQSKGITLLKIAYVIFVILKSHDFSCDFFCDVNDF